MIFEEAIEDSATPSCRFNTKTIGFGSRRLRWVIPLPTVLRRYSTSHVGGLSRLSFDGPLKHSFCPFPWSLAEPQPQAGASGSSSLHSHSQELLPGASGTWSAEAHSGVPKLRTARSPSQWWVLQQIRADRT